MPPHNKTQNTNNPIKNTKSEKGAKTKARAQDSIEFYSSIFCYKGTKIF
jgi:hypothetical protein